MKDNRALKNDENALIEIEKLDEIMRLKAKSKVRSFKTINRTHF